MKSILSALIVFASLSSTAYALSADRAMSALENPGVVIDVKCTCSFFADYITTQVMVTGSSSNPTENELANCRIEDGIVVSGCWAAKMNAQYNCDQAAAPWQSTSNSGQGSTSSGQSAGHLHTNECYGIISKVPGSF